MKAVEARDAMCSMVLAAWNTALYGPMLWQGKSGEPPADGPWGRTSIQHFPSSADGIGDLNSSYCIKGVLTVQCFSPVGKSTDTAYNAAQSIVDNFSGVRSGSIVFRNPHVRELPVDGNFNQVNALVSFEYTDVR